MTAGRSEREVAFLLLVLQAGIGLLTAAGPILLAAGGAPGDLLLGIAAILLSVAELALAMLLLRGGRRAATWLAGYQALCLAGANLALLFRLGADSHLAALVNNVGLPVLLLVLLLRIRYRAAMPGRALGSATV